MDYDIITTILQIRQVIVTQPLSSGLLVFFIFQNNQYTVKPLI